MGWITKLGDQKTIIASGYAKTNELKTAQELGLESILSAKYQKNLTYCFTSQSQNLSQDPWKRRLADAY
jgi:hypothetical protein